jgi:hypothetical protein
MGHWEALRPEVWETVVTPCDACGQVVPTRVWRAEVEGRELRFCSETCEQLYREYVLPARQRAGIA